VVTRTVRTRYLEIAYEEWGDPTRPPVVLVHGWPDDVRCWQEVAPLLAQHYRVLAPHLRGHGMTRFLSEATHRSGQISALGHDLAQFLDGLDVRDALVVGHDWGARAGYAVAALDPSRLAGLVAISAGYGSSGPKHSIPYALAHAYWYEWFVATDYGRRMVYDDRDALCRYLWRSWSPGWQFSGEEFDTTALAWHNDDWAAITVHAYLHRWGEATGAPEYAQWESHLADLPPIDVPTLVLHGDEDADNLPVTTEGKEPHFRASYTRRLLPGVGHFVPREAPRETAAAVREFADQHHMPARP
jgi:pimeloyl-ACP methyl ester carboxylesterase